MNNHTNFKILITFLVATFAINADALSEFDKQRPDNVGDKKWTSLKAAVQENNSKLLPTPIGVGGKNSNYGDSVSIDGDRALVGSPSALTHGVAYILDYDGSSWVETQVIFPDDINTGFGSKFGISVSLQGNRALIGDNTNRINSKNQGAAYVYELMGGSWQQTKKIFVNDGRSNDQFGISVSLLGDRALIGALNALNPSNNSSTGLAFIYDYVGNDWSQSAVLVGDDSTVSDGFGHSVHLGIDQAIIGAVDYSENNNGVKTGAAYLFTLDSGLGTWSQSKQFLASDGVHTDDFGHSVSLSGNRVAIGAQLTDETASGSGSVYVYELDTGTGLWLETKIVEPVPISSNQFGSAVSIQNNRLIVGARQAIVDNARKGSVTIYEYNVATSVWDFSEQIVAADGKFSDSFGDAVGLSSNRIIVGTPQSDDNGVSSGSAYVFELNGSWQQSQKFLGLGATDSNFGYAISLDGNRALIGAPLDNNENGFTAGAAYIFDYINGQWSVPHKIISSDLFLNFGMSVSLSGNTAIIGANRIDFSSTGQAYIFDFDGTAWTETIILTTDFIGDDEFAYSVSLSGDRALVGAFFDTGNEARSGTAHIFEKSITGWQPAGKLMASDGVNDDSFGISVSLFGDRALVGAYAKDDDVNGLSRAGAAYVYDYDSANDLWSETKLQAIVPSSSGFFGWDVEIKNDRAIIGATGNSDSAYVFDYDSLSDSWNPTKLISSASARNGQFGTSVSLDGDRALVGAYFETNNGITNSGSVYQYGFDGADWVEVKKHTANDAETSDYYGWAVGLSGRIAIFGSYQDDDRGTDSGSVYTINDIGQLFADGFEN